MKKLPENSHLELQFVSVVSLVDVKVDSYFFSTAILACKNKLSGRIEL